MVVHPGEGGSRFLALSPDEEGRLLALEKRLGITFHSAQLVQESMTHASWANERGDIPPLPDNERLEYLGDAVLELVVGEHLFRTFPTHHEGQLTQQRASLVNTQSLARLSEKLELGTTLLLGRGAVKTGAGSLPSLLANAFEALMGAIFLDHGYPAVARLFWELVGDLSEWGDTNYKGKLQEVAQSILGVAPHYKSVASAARGSQREYRAQAIVNHEILGEGNGLTKQSAEQAAAQSALEHPSLHPLTVAVPAPVVTSDRSGPRSSSGRGRPRSQLRPIATPVATLVHHPVDHGVVGRLRKVVRVLTQRPASPKAPTPPTDVVTSSRSRSRRRRRPRGGGTPPQTPG